MNKEIFYDNGLLNKNKLRESWIRSNYNSEYLKIKEFQSKYKFNDLKFSNVIYNYINNIIDIPKCFFCKKENKRFIGFKEGYNDFCSKKCAAKFSKPDSIKKRKENTFNKFGVDHTSQLESVKEKQKNTNINKYGFKSPTLNISIREKQEETMLMKYGVKYTGNSDYLMSKVFDKRFNKYKESIYKTYYDLNIIDIIKEGELKIKCDICNKEYIIKTDFLRLRHLRYKVAPCTFCNPNNSYKYTGQNEIYEFLQQKNLNIVRNERNILNGKEIDIYLPDLKIGIEFNGLYWHSSLFKDKLYHLDKKNKCENVGVNLIHIWEDDWILKKDIIKSRLLNIIGITPNKIWARNCKIIEIDNKTAKFFLEENHLQGFIYSSYNLALTFNDEIVSLMTFGKFRRSLGMSNIENSWELYRFCNKINFNVVGSFNKLLSFFENNKNPKSLLTYANKDWSNNDNIYSKSGFELISCTPVNYWYFDNRYIKRYHRFSFRKDKLIKEGYDKTKTEKQIMMEKGYNTIYDCGSLKYLKKY